MRRRHRALLATLVLAVVLVGVWWAVVWPRLQDPADTRPAAPLDLASVRHAFASADPTAIKPALAALARADPPPVDWLLEGLRSPDRGVREWSAHALGDIAPKRADVIDALIVAFEDPDDWVRWKAARALGNLHARKALEMLRKVANADPKQETEVVRAAALVAVKQIEASP